MRRLQVQHNVTGTCVKTPILKSFPLLSIQRNANDIGEISGCSAWASITCARQANRRAQMPVVLILGCLGCILDQELMELTVSFVFWLNASKMFVFHLIFLHWLFLRHAVHLGPNSGAAETASGAGKSGCRNGHIQQLLGVAKWLWQPDLSVKSQAGCCSCGVGRVQLEGGTGCCCHGSPVQQGQVLSVPRPHSAAEAPAQGVLYLQLSVTVLPVFFPYPGSQSAHQKCSEAQNLFFSPVHLPDQDY